MYHSLAKPKDWIGIFLTFFAVYKWPLWSIKLLKIVQSSTVLSNLYHLKISSWSIFLSIVHTYFNFLIEDTSNVFTSNDPFLFTPSLIVLPNYKPLYLWPQLLHFYFIPSVPDSTFFSFSHSLLTIIFTLLLYSFCLYLLLFPIELDSYQFSNHLCLSLIYFCCLLHSKLPKQSLVYLSSTLSYFPQAEAL